MRNETSKNQKNKNNIYDYVVYGMMMIAVVFIIIQTFTENFTSLGFRVILGVWILIAVGISDFVGPLMMGELDRYDSKQNTKYVFTCILDALAYMCLYIFVIFVGNYTEITHYIYLIAAALMFLVRIMVNRSIGAPHEEETPERNQRSQIERLNLQGRERKPETDEDDEGIEIDTFRSREHSEE